MSTDVGANNMSVDEIVEKLADGYRLEYAPVYGGQCLSHKHSDTLINLTFADFDAARKDARVGMIESWQQGHPVFHGPVYQYGLVV